MTTDITPILNIEERTFSRDTFNDIYDSNHLLKIDITLGDGNKFSNALTMDWVQMSKNIKFSTNSSAISVNDQGYEIYFYFCLVFIFFLKIHIKGYHCRCPLPPKFGDADFFC